MQVQDRRSAVNKQACSTLAALSLVFGTRFVEHAIYFLPLVFSVLPLVKVGGIHVLHGVSSYTVLSPISPFWGASFVWASACAVANTQSYLPLLLMLHVALHSRCLARVLPASGTQCPCVPVSQRPPIHVTCVSRKRSQKTAGKRRLSTLISLSLQHHATLDLLQLDATTSPLCAFHARYDGECREVPMGGGAYGNKRSPHPPKLSVALDYALRCK